MVNEIIESLVDMKMLKTKFIVLLILCSTLFVVPLTGISIYYAQNNAKSVAESKLSNLTTSYSNQLNNMITERESVAKSIEAYILATFDLNAFYNDDDYFDNYIIELELFIEEMAYKFSDSWICFNPELLGKAFDIWYFDQFGTGTPERMPQNEIEMYSDVNDPSMKWYHDPIKKKRPIWTDPYLFNISDENATILITYSIPIFIGDVFVGIAGSDFEVTQLLKEMSNVVVYDTGYAFVTNQEFNYVVHPDYDYNSSLLGTDPDLYERIITNKSDIANVINYSEKELLVSYVETLNNWNFLLVVPTMEIYSLVFQQILIMLLISLLMFVFVVFMGVVLSIRITKPLELLTDSVTLIGEGHYDINLPSKIFDSKDEVGQLVNSVQKMSTVIKESLESVNEKNVELDILVKQRTAELLDANEELSISLELLQKLQVDIITKEKKAALTRIMMEINHRVNTPLSVSMNFLNYAKESLKNSSENINEDILTSLDKSEEQLKIVVEIIKSLSNIMINLSTDDIADIHIVEIFNNRIKTTLSMLSGINKLNIEFSTTGDLKLNTYPNVVSTIFDQLLRFSALFPLEIENRSISVAFKRKNNYIKIIYSDIEAFRTVNKTDIFEPFKYISFKRGLVGMEMYILQELCTNTLSGQIQFNNEDAKSPYIEIDIPDLKNLLLL